MTPNEREQVRAALKEARTNRCGYVVTKEHPYPEAIADLWREIQRMNKKIGDALAILKADSKPEPVTDKDREEADANFNLVREYLMVKIPGTPLEIINALSRIRSDAVKAERERYAERVSNLPRYRVTVYESVSHGVSCEVVRASDLSAILSDDKEQPNAKE